MKDVVEKMFLFLSFLSLSPTWIGLGQKLCIKRVKMRWARWTEFQEAEEREPHTLCWGMMHWRGGGVPAPMMRECARAENWVQIPTPSLSSCMTLGVSCNLSAPKLLICKMVIIVISNYSLGGLHELA